jgi:UDP-N-acetyl-D-glucosamine/UDP-N-acetyl-D-galactosamine dehydrogenase
MNKIIAVVGLGYVGLHLAIEFGRVLPTIGYDLSSAKIKNFPS